MIAEPALDDDLLAAVAALVQRAGAAILEIYETDFDVERKGDDSPLTQADLAAHAILRDGLAELAPWPLLSEESEAAPFEERSTWSRYWLVDPLDGTKEFVSRNGEFTVNVALIEDGQPRLGVVGVPVQERLYWGDVARGAAWVRTGTDAAKTLAGRPVGQSLSIVASRSHGSERLEAYLDALGAGFDSVERRPVGSSLKLCLLAEGGADIYPRLGPTSEWDIGAAHAVLLAAGGDLWSADGSAMTYNAKVSLLNPEFIAVADKGYGWRSKVPPVPTGGHEVPVG